VGDECITPIKTVPIVFGRGGGTGWSNPCSMENDPQNGEVDDGLLTIINPNSACCVCHFA